MPSHSTTIDMEFRDMRTWENAEFRTLSGGSMKSIRRL